MVLGKNNLEVNKQYNVKAIMTVLLFGGFLSLFNETILNVSRMIQATGTGMLVPIMMNTALAVSPPEKRGSTMGLCVCAILMGPALGPIVSGTLLQFFHWQSLFIVLIPFALVSIISGAIFLENVSTITKPKIDYLSIVLSTVGFAGIIYGISSINDASANKSVVIVSFAAGIIGLIFFTSINFKRTNVRITCI